MAAITRQSPPDTNAGAIGPDGDRRGFEAAMSRIVLACCLAAALASCGTPYAQQSDWARAQSACADVGLDPGSAVFGQCVADLYFSLWNVENVAER